MRIPLLLLLPFTLDRLSKYWIYTYTSDYVLNRGISWNMFHSESTYIYFFVSFIVVLVSGALVLMCVHTPQAGYLLMVSGGISNIYDRFIYGGVLDFIHLSYKGWSWPLFNLADVTIVIGVIVMWYTKIRCHA